MSLEKAIVNKQYDIVESYLKKNKIKFDNKIKIICKYMKDVLAKAREYASYGETDEEFILILACCLNDKNLVKLILTYNGLPEDHRAVETMLNIAYYFLNYDIIENIIAYNINANVVKNIIICNSKRKYDRNLTGLFLHHEYYRTALLPLVLSNEILSLEIIKLGVANFDDISFVAGDVLNFILKNYDVKQLDLNRWIKIAVRFNMYNDTKIIIENGADIKGLYELAIEHCSDDVIKCFKKDANILNKEINKTNNSVKKIKMLIDNGADVNYKDKYNNTPLIVASEKNNYEIVKLLLDNGAVDYNGMAKFLAVQNKSSDALKLLC